MKRFFVMILAILMVLSMVACGGGKAPTEAPEVTEAPVKETEAPTEAPETEPPVTEPEVLDVTIGDYYVVYNGAYEYGSNEFGSNFIVFVEFTSNADQAYMPYTRVYIEVKQDEKVMGGVEWSEEKSPAIDMMKKDRVELAPGETTNYYNGFKYNPEGGMITITIMDNFHKLEEKLIIEIDPAELVSYEKS